MNFAQRKNLRIARFLNRIVFCFFAEDTGLLPKDLFTEILKTAAGRPGALSRRRWKTCSPSWPRAARFGKDKIRHFNGHLFEDSTVFELTEGGIAEAGRSRRSGLAIHSAQHHGHAF